RSTIGGRLLHGVAASLQACGDRLAVVRLRLGRGLLLLLSLRLLLFLRLLLRLLLLLGGGAPGSLPCRRRRRRRRGRGLGLGRVEAGLLYGPHVTFALVLELLLGTLALGGVDDGTLGSAGRDQEGHAQDRGESQHQMLHFSSPTAEALPARRGRRGT